MSDNIDRIRLMANYISAGTSLADNPVVKVHKLKNLEIAIISFLSSHQLTKEQELLYKFVLNTISDLKYLKGDEYRLKAIALSGQVSMLLETPLQK